MSMLQMKMCCGTGGRRIESRTGDVSTGAVATDGGLTVVQSACGAQRLVLAQVADRDVGEVAPGLFDEAGHLGVVVEADDDDLAEAWNARERLERMPDHRLACDRQQRLRACHVSAGGGGRGGVQGDMIYTILGSGGAYSRP